MLPTAVASGIVASERSNVQLILVGIGYTFAGTAAMAFLPAPLACSRLDLKILFRNAKVVPPAAQTTTTNAIVAISDLRLSAPVSVANCSPLTAPVGRGFPTCAADKMNFGSADVGAWGTMIF